MTQLASRSPGPQNAACGRVGHRSTAQRLGAKAHQVQAIHEVHQRRADAQPLLVRRDIGHVVAHAGDQGNEPGAVEGTRPGALDFFGGLPTLLCAPCEQPGQCNALTVTNHDEPERPQTAMVGRTQGQVRSAGPLLCARSRRRQVLRPHRVAQREQVQQFVPAFTPAALPGTPPPAPAS
jgi:hypothetical protein